MQQHRDVKLGKRLVCTMNFSKVVTLPKAFTDNYLDDKDDEGRTVEMSMTPDGRLTLTPVRGKK